MIGNFVSDKGNNIENRKCIEHGIDDFDLINTTTNSLNITNDYINDYQICEVMNNGVYTRTDIAPQKRKRKKTHISTVKMDSFTQMQLSSSDSESETNIEFPSNSIGNKDILFSNLSIIHVPICKSTRLDGKYQETRKYCPICKKRVNTFCKNCDVALCFGNGTARISCWEKYHSNLS